MIGVSYHRKAVIIGLICAGMAATWQFLTVRYNYQGDWSALFCTGEHARLSPVLAAEHPYEFAGMDGWDGQWYHAIAHDPLLRRGTAPFLDSARLRYRRILVPAVAFILAAGNDAFIDRAYRLALLLFFGLGAWWLARLALAAGKPALLGLAFFVLPASVASLDRSAVDVALMCFCAGFAFYSRSVERPAALYGLLLLAGLVRETGLLLTAAYCLWLLLERDIRRCALFATAAAPTLGWYAFVNSRTPPYSGAGAIVVPFSGVAHRLIHIMDGAGGSVEKLIRSADLLAAAGVLLAMLLAIRVIWRRRPIRWTSPFCCSRCWVS